MHKLESVFCQVEGEVRTVMFVTIDGRGCLKLEQMMFPDNLTQATSFTGTGGGGSIPDSDTLILMILAWLAGNEK